jgi:hypothetical protein
MGEVTLNSTHHKSVDVINEGHQCKKVNENVNKKKIMALPNTWILRCFSRDIV